VYESALPGFYRLELKDRVTRIGEITGVGSDELAALDHDGGLDASQANLMVENAVGVFGLPLGICANLRVDGQNRLVPMATEEPSVVAAASHAAKLLRGGEGIQTVVSPALMLGQIQLLEVADGERLHRAVADNEAELLAKANGAHSNLVAAGGGARSLSVRHLPAIDHDDPLGDMWIVEVLVDVQDAMGANAINSMCERIAPRIAELGGGRVNLRILSNLSDQRTVRATGRMPVLSFCPDDPEKAMLLAERIVEASVFAERDPYRAATHNKGIMNGVDAVLMAFGQDTRAVEAGAHAFTARSGRYTSMSRFRVDGDHLVAVLELPMAVGTVGGVAAAHPTVAVARRIANITRARELASVAAAVGLAQNLAALKALAGEGIQSGHMRLHARKSTPPKALNTAPSPRSLDALSKAHLPNVEAMLTAVAAEELPEASPILPLLEYHLSTGGKRLRALLPLWVAEALDQDPARFETFGAACEMLHNATLVHDDVQDGDETRRGKATVWAAYGEARAIDLGDAMFHLAMLLVQRMDLPTMRRERLGARLARETLRVIDGQEREIMLLEKGTPSEADYFEMVEGKTSGLFGLPIAGAAEAAGAAPALVEELSEAARHLGVLFQIQDDLLDIYGDKGRERRGSDIAEGKRSMLAVHALLNASADDRATLLTILDAPRAETSDADIERAIAIFESTGAVRRALDEIESRRLRSLAGELLTQHPALIDLIGDLSDVFLEPIKPLIVNLRRAS